MISLLLVHVIFAKLGFAKLGKYYTDYTNNFSWLPSLPQFTLIISVRVYRPFFTADEGPRTEMSCAYCIMFCAM